MVLFNVYQRFLYNILYEYHSINPFCMISCSSASLATLSILVFHAGQPRMVSRFRAPEHFQALFLVIAVFFLFLPPVEQIHQCEFVFGFFAVDVDNFSASITIIRCMFAVSMPDQTGGSHATDGSSGTKPQPAGRSSLPREIYKEEKRSSGSRMLRR